MPNYKDKIHMDPMISSVNSNEYFNSILHLLGTILAFAGTTFLIVLAAQAGKWVHLVSFSIYGLTLFLSFLASSILHFNLLFNRYYRLLGIFDHNAIFLLIAGTYTPLALAVFGGTMGWGLFTLIWCLAAFNIAIKSIFFAKMGKKLSTLCFVLMGWPVIFYAWPIAKLLGIDALILMIVGGLVYTLGAFSFTIHKPDPFPPYFGNHEIWHLAVFIGNAIFFYFMYAHVLNF